MSVYAPARANPLQRLVPPFQPEAEMPSDHPLSSYYDFDRVVASGSLGYLD